MFYIFGYARRTKEPVIVSYMKTAQGWSSRLVYGNTVGLGNDYVSNEKRQDLDKWFKVDFVREPRVTEERAVAMEWVLSTKKECQS